MARTSSYESGELTDSIFLILLTTLEPVHGYRMMQMIQTMTGGSVEIGPATMYTTLKKLRTAGWISEVGEEDSKIVYRITEQGSRVLDKDYKRRMSIVEIAKQAFQSGGKRHG